MKKLIKRTLALCLAVLILTSLCGCNALDELREDQAILQEDGSITWKGTIYLPIGGSEYLYPELSDKLLNVTGPDVPVLASFFDAQFYASPSMDNMLLQCTSNMGETSFYCRQADYDALIQRLTGEFPADLVCFFYTALEGEEYVEKHYTLTQAQNAALLDVFENTEPKAASQVGAPNGDTNIYLFQCSQDLMLRRCNATLTKAGQQYVLQIAVENDTLLYLIPQKHQQTIEEIFQAYDNAMWGALGTEI